MEKLLLISLLLLCGSFASCETKHKRTIKRQNTDYIHPHNAPDQKVIDSIKQIKTRKKLESQNSRN